MRFPIRYSLVLALSLSACGRDVTAPANTEVVAQPRVAQGAIVKGPLVGATVSFFHMDDAGQPVGAPIQTVVSDAQGHVTAALPQTNELLLAVTSGGSYVDESDDAGGDARRHVTLGANQGFQSVVPANATTFAITPYTMALLLRAREIGNGGNFGIIYPLVVNQAKAAFGFDPTTVIPDDPLAPNLDTPAEAKYALLLGGAAYAIDAIATASGQPVSYAIILAFIADLSDGILDGSINGSQVDFKALTIGGSTISINGETLRFRNNHYQQYLDLIASIDEGALSVPPPDLPADLPPVAHTDSITVVRGGNASELDSGDDSVLDNDFSPSGAPLTAQVETSPLHGALTLNPDGTFLYKNDGSPAQTDSFTYTAHTPTASSLPTTVFITIVNGNNNPCSDSSPPRKATISSGDEFRACNDSYTVQCSNSLYGDVTNNDIIPPLDASLSANLLSDASLGYLSWEGDGTFFYFAPSCYPVSKVLTTTETDSFSYNLHLNFGEGGLTSNTANVKITVDFSCLKTGFCGGD